MSIAQSLLAEFETQAPITRKFLERVPQDKLMWRPHAKSHTAGELALHIAMLPAFVVRFVLGDSSPVLVGNRLYVFTRQGDDEVTLCLDAANGKELWKDKYAAVAVTGAAAFVGGGHPGPRGTVGERGTRRRAVCGRQLPARRGNRRMYLHPHPEPSGRVDGVLHLQWRRLLLAAPEQHVAR